MQTAGYLVGAAAELTAGVQYREHRFDGALARLGVDVGWDTAAVVDYLNAAIGLQYHRDFCGMAGEGFVDAVVDQLPHQVVKTFHTGATDVHARALAHGLESFEHLDLICRISFLFISHF